MAGGCAVDTDKAPHRRRWDGEHPGLTDPGLPWTPLPRRGGDKGPRCKQLGWTDTSQVALRAKRVANRRARVLNLIYGSIESMGVLNRPAGVQKNENCTDSTRKQTGHVNANACRRKSETGSESEAWGYG